MDINLTTYSTTPSDHEAPDGTLSCMGNLVYEEGALQPIQVPDTVTEITLPAGCAYDSCRLFIHKCDTDGTDTENYLLLDDKNSKVYWSDTYATMKAGTWTEITDLASFSVNDITFTGRIVALVGDNETRWAFYDPSLNDAQGGYYVVTMDDFKYKIDVKSTVYRDDITETSDVLWTVEFGTDFSGYLRLSDNNLDENTQAYGLTAEGTKGVLEHIDAEINKNMSNNEYVNKYISFGLAAVRMYDGSYIALSDIFAVGGKLNLENFLLKFHDKQMDASYSSMLHLDTVQVTFANQAKLEKIEHLIQGVDIFLSSPSYYKRYDTAHSFGSVIVKPWKDTSVVTSLSISLDVYDSKRLTDSIDDLPFFRVAEISYSDLHSQFESTPVVTSLKTVDETETAITLNDWGRSKYGAHVVKSYNERLHLGDYTDNVQPNAFDQITYKFYGYQIKAGSDAIAGISWNGIGVRASNAVQTSGDEQSLCSCNYYIAIHYSDKNGVANTRYEHGTGAQFPLPPVIMVPVTDVKSVDVYVENTSGSTNVYYYRENIPFHTCDTGSWSYFAFQIGSQVSFLTNEKYNSTTEVWESVGDFTHDTGGTRYGEITTAWDRETNHALVESYPNRILLSAVDNPIAFKNTNSVTVSNARILALATNTQPLAEGQAGQTPLYAFTDEGIWPLYTNTNGTYSATQPGPRDVLAHYRNAGTDHYNTDSITPIDSAVLFMSDRGLMMLAGNNTQCLSDSLRMYTNDTDIPALGKVMKAMGFTDIDDDISSYVTSGDFMDIIHTCKIAYDYPGQRIVVFSPGAPAAFVYSLRSQAWGMMDSSLYDTVNSYPDAFALSHSGSDSTKVALVDLFSKAAAECPVFAITRPMGLGAPDTLKRLEDAIVRGMFMKSNINIAVWGSRDLYSWHYISSAKGPYIRNHNGTPYKYFRFVIGGKLNYGETIQALTLDIGGSQVNKSR